MKYTPLKYISYVKDYFCLNVCETWSFKPTKNDKLGGIVKRARGGGGIPRPERSADADNCVIRSFLICTIHYFKGH